MSSAVERFDDKARESFESAGQTTVYRGELLRHPVYTRVLHWTVALFFFLALFTGAIFTEAIFVADQNGANVRQLTTPVQQDQNPQWSPDGHTLIFFSARAGNADVWRLDLAPKSLRQLTSDPGLDINPFFSPDGAHIAFQSDRSGRLEVWVMNSDGSHQRQLSTIGVTGHFLRWSRGGENVLFRCPCGGKPQIYQISAKGGEPVPLNSEIAGGCHMSFSPGFSLLMDVVGHQTLWVSSVTGGKPLKVYEFPVMTNLQTHGWHMNACSVAPPMQCYAKEC